MPRRRRRARPEIELDMSSDTIFRAKFLCEAAHRAIGQLRKFGGARYETHPIRVAKKIEDWFNEEVVDMDYYVVKAAAYLHDVVEDTHITVYDVAYFINDDVAGIVQELTFVDEQGKKLSQAEYLQHIKTMSQPALIIKIADMYDNYSDISLAAEDNDIKVEMEILSTFLLCRTNNKGIKQKNIFAIRGAKNAFYIMLSRVYRKTIH